MRARGRRMDCELTIIFIVDEERAGCVTLSGHALDGRQADSSHK